VLVIEHSEAVLDLLKRMRVPIRRMSRAATMNVYGLLSGIRTIASMLAPEDGSNSPLDLSPPLLYRQAVDHGPAAGRLPRGAQCVLQIPVAEDDSAEYDDSSMDRYVYVSVIEIGLSMQSRSHPPLQFRVLGIYVLRI
jgi:hypothetical protein